MIEIEKLLAVLDLDEADQGKWVAKWLDDNEPRLLGSFNRGELSLADLAFRLRDEIKDLKHKDSEWGELNSLYEAQKEVYEKVIGKTPYSEPLADWWIKDSQPIHWIIAALIAKQLAKPKRQRR